MISDRFQIDFRQENKAKGKVLDSPDLDAGRKREKGKCQPGRFGLDLTRHPHRAHARTTRNDFLVGLTPQPPMYLYRLGADIPVPKPVKPTSAYIGRYLPTSADIDRYRPVSVLLVWELVYRPQADIGTSEVGG